MSIMSDALCIGVCSLKWLGLPSSPMAESEIATVGEALPLFQ